MEPITHALSGAVIGYALPGKRRWWLPAWAALVAGILYAVSMVCMFLYALFVALQMIFCFVAFARMKHSQTRPVTRIGYWQKDRP